LPAWGRFKVRQELGDWLEFVSDNLPGAIFPRLVNNLFFQRASAAEFWINSEGLGVLGRGTAVGPLESLEHDVRTQAIKYWYG
jgi:hypothetical protein